MPFQPQAEAREGNQQDGHRYLQPAQSNQTVTHIPQGARGQFKPDDKQHHHHAKFGKMLQILGFTADQAQNGANDQPCQQISQDGPKPKSRRQRHRNYGGGKINGSLCKQFGHE